MSILAMPFVEGVSGAPGALGPKEQRMTTTLSEPTVDASEAPGRHPVLRAGLTSGAVAAVATTAMAAVADAAGVPLAVDGEAIPLAGFAQMTLLGAVLGGLLAAGLGRHGRRARQAFISITVVLTALSCVPSVALPPDAASKLVLVATHVGAAAIIVPALARQIRR